MINILLAGLLFLTTSGVGSEFLCMGLNIWMTWSVGVYASLSFCYESKRGKKPSLPLTLTLLFHQIPICTLVFQAIGYIQRVLPEKEGRRFDEIKYLGITRLSVLATTCTYLSINLYFLWKSFDIKTLVLIIFLGLPSIPALLLLFSQRLQDWGIQLIECTLDGVCKWKRYLMHLILLPVYGVVMIENQNLRAILTSKVSSFAPNPES